MKTYMKEQINAEDGDQINKLYANKKLQSRQYNKNEISQEYWKTVQIGATEINV